MEVKIRVMTNLKEYVATLGKKILITYVLIDLKTKIKDDIVFVMKVKTAALIALPKRNHLKINVLHTENLLVCLVLQQIKK